MTTRVFLGRTTKTLQRAGNWLGFCIEEFQKVSSEEDSKFTRLYKRLGIAGAMLLLLGLILFLLLFVVYAIVLMCVRLLVWAYNKIGR